MTQEFFADQIKRLRDEFGQKAYSAERIKLIFTAVKSYPDHWLEGFVNHAVGNMRTAPLLKDFTDDATDWQRREAASRFNDNHDGSLAGVISYAAQANTTADPQFVKACMKLLGQKLNGEISPQQFAEGCDMLDHASMQTVSKECPRCANTGYVVNDHRLFRCSCAHGSKRPEIILAPPERDGTRTEHRIPILTKANWKNQNAGRDRATGERE